VARLAQRAAAEVVVYLEVGFEIALLPEMGL
jgi:hypothetical protein